MKKWMSALLMILLLVQSLPLNALAAAGHVLTGEELAAAYALTGFDEDGVRSNSAWHKGMRPNASWNAMQVSEWLDEALDTDIFSVEEILSQASVKLAQLKQSSPEDYRRFAGGEYEAVVDYVQEMYQAAEALRQELRHLRDGIEEQAGIIAGLGRRLEEERELLYPSEQARLSAKIEIATDALKAIRGEVVERAEQWQSDMEQMQLTLDPAYEGAPGEGPVPGLAGDWIHDLLACQGEAITNTSNVVVSVPTSTRMGRMAASNSVLSSNGDNATVHVMSESEVGLLFYTSDEKGERQPLEGIGVTVKDARNASAKAQTYSTDSKGAVYIPSSHFIVDNEKTVEFRLDVDAEKKNCRSIGVERMQLKLGEVRKMPLRPIGKAGDATGGAPYVYSAAFEGNDILFDSYDMLYTDLNDWNFEISVEVRSPGGGEAPAPKLGYWTTGNSAWKWEQKWAEPTAREGNRYIFKDSWKRILAPEVDDARRPFIAFSVDASAERFSTYLISNRSVVDSPVEEGSDVFEQVLDQGLGFEFHIPVVDISVGLKLPFMDYLPKFQVDLAGYATMSIGGPMFEERLKQSRLAWQSFDMAVLTQRQEALEKESGLANYKSQLGVAYEEYRQKGWQFYGQSKLDVGLFAVISARWEIDNNDGNVTRKIVKGRGAIGVLVKYSYSWTIMHLVGPVPVYITFTLGVSAGFAVDALQVGFSWDGKSFHDWQSSMLKNITIDIAFTFTAQFGAGIKDFLEVWLRFKATLDFRLSLLIYGSGHSSFVITGSLELKVGVTIFWVEASRTFGPWEGTLYDSSASANALPPLQQYAIANANAPEEIVPASQEPTSYPELTPTAKAILSNEEDAHSVIKVATSFDHTFAFYLDKIRNPYSGQLQQRVCWIDVDTGARGNTQRFLRYEMGTARSEDRDDYAFDVWSDGKTIFILGCCADRFENSGYPVASTLIDAHTYAYMIPVQFRSEDNDLEIVTSNFKAAETNTVNLDGALNPRGITNPRIEWAKVSYDRDNFINTVELYGFAECVSDGSGEKNWACFTYAGNYFGFMSDMAVGNALGDDHERVNLRSSVKGYGGPIDSDSRGNHYRCYGFVALSQPRPGANDDGEIVEGERAIEFYDWDMNRAQVEYETTVDRGTTPPTVEVKLTKTNRRAVALKRGDIGALEVIYMPSSDSDAFDQTLFYTEAETTGNGAKQYKLKLLNIGSKEGALSKRVSYKLMDIAYDIAIPSSEFRVQMIGDIPYIYWLSITEKKQESDPDTWRLWVCMYDHATGTMSTPTVYSEFTLPGNMLPRDVVLTTEGQGYLTATPMPKDGDRQPQPMTLYSFPLTMKQVLTLQGMVMEDATVEAGDFEDTTMVLMNEGNMGISAFDVEMYTLEGGRANVVETLHCDCLKPENSRLTMYRDGRSVTLPEGRQAIYRNSDFDCATRQRDWMLSQRQQTMTLELKDSQPWTCSITDRDTESAFIQTQMLMPGALASFTAALKIPEDWSGDKTLYLRVSSVSANANWQRAIANAAGRGIASNTAPSQTLTWVLDEQRGKMVLQSEGIAANSADDGAVRLGLIANEVNAPEPIAMKVDIHDLDVDHRLYGDVDGTELLDIIVSNDANTDIRFKLSCAVYLDGEEEPHYVNLPYYDQAVSHGMTHTITVPVAALVGDPDAHSRARVVITAVGQDESAYANNEFTLPLSGGSPLRFSVQPEDATVQEGGDVSFAVEVAGGRQPYSYQWQMWDPKGEKWVDLPGFTGPILSREGVEKKWDGAKFRCVVTDAEGTQIVSQTVTLTVRNRVDTGDSANLPLYLTVALAALALLALLRRMRNEG